MARYAVISNGVIANLVDWDGGPQWSPPPGHTAALAPMPCSIGWTWNNGAPVDPNPPPAPPPPFDPGDSDNLAKTLKAVLLAAAVMSGRTPAQAKAAFLQAWQALP